MKNYEHHIIDERTTNLTGEKVSFCGERLSTEFNLESVGHAVSSIQAGSLVIPCRKCVKVIIKILKEK